MITGTNLKTFIISAPPSNQGWSLDIIDSTKIHNKVINVLNDFSMEETKYLIEIISKLYPPTNSLFPIFINQLIFNTCKYEKCTFKNNMIYYDYKLSEFITIDNISQHYLKVGTIELFQFLKRKAANNIKNQYDSIIDEKIIVDILE